MGLYIKGMEMPKSCSVCPMLEGDRMDGLCHAASKWLDDDEHWAWYVYPEGDMDDSKPCNCPLVSVQPHGDLVDRDEMREIAISLLDKAVTDQEANAIREMWSRLGQMPVFIPAEE